MTAAAPPIRGLPRHPIGSRVGIAVWFVFAGLAAVSMLDLSWRDLLPSEAGLSVAGRFLSRSLSPALVSEARFVPADAPPLLWNVLHAAFTTLWMGAAAMGLSLVAGLLLAFLAASAWWSPDLRGGEQAGAGVRARLSFVVCGATRIVIAIMRSIHEVVWALLLLTAVGLSDLAAVIALAIPTAGILAKVFSELIDETPRDAARALRGSGASGLQVFCFALLTRAAPDMIAYSFYRFECIMRSAAVLGFFGFATLGLYIRQSFRAANYGEVWTYLYALLLMLVVFDIWSGALRRRLMS